MQRRPHRGRGADPFYLDNKSVPDLALCSQYGDLPDPSFWDTSSQRDNPAPMGSAFGGQWEFVAQPAQARALFDWSWP